MHSSTEVRIKNAATFRGPVKFKWYEHLAAIAYYLFLFALAAMIAGLAVALIITLFINTPGFTTGLVLMAILFAGFKYSIEHF